MTARKNKVYLFVVVLVIVVAAAVALNLSRSSDVSANVTEKANPAMSVNVVETVLQPVQIWKSFSARLEAVDFVEIRPQVNGTIVDVRFKDGQHVNKGEVLFVIDPAPYLAQVNQASAELSNMQNEYEFAELEFTRAQKLVKTKAMSERIYDERKNRAQVAGARVEEAKARLQQAQIDLDRAYVKAPISGRTSQIEVTLGNLVESGPNAPVLTSIVSTRDIYADFDVDDQTYIQFVRQKAKDRDAESSVPVKMILSGDTRVYQGTIYTFDNQLDVSSGTIRARALFSNEDGALLPGMFAMIQLGSSVMDDRLLVDEKAIGTDQDRKYVYVVDGNHQVTYREVVLGEKVAGKRIVLSGLSAGEQVIVDNLMTIRPGMQVVPTLQTQHLDRVDTLH